MYLYYAILNCKSLSCNPELLFFFSQAKLSVLYSKWQNFLYCTTANNDKIFKIIVIVDNIPSRSSHSWLSGCPMLWLPWWRQLVRAIHCLLHFTLLLITFRLHTKIHLFIGLPCHSYHDSQGDYCHDCYDFWFIFLSPLSVLTQ